MHPPAAFEFGPRTMVPLEGKTLEDLVRIALLNIEAFDHARFDTWRRGRGGGISKLADRRPPDKLYRIITDNERESEGCDAPLLVGIVVGYQEAARGAPAMCRVQVLGVHAGAGSYEEPLAVPEDALEDVTERAQAGKLVFR